MAETNAAATTTAATAAAAAFTNGTTASAVNYGFARDVLHIVNAAAMLPSLCSIACILAAILSTPLRDNYRHVVFANLLLSDACFLVVSDVVVLLVWRGVTIPPLPCYAYAMLATTLNHVGVLGLALMSLERYAAVCHPLRYQARFDRRLAVASLGVIWFAASLFPLARCAIVFASSGEMSSAVNYTRCSVDKIEGSLPNFGPLIVVLRELVNGVFLTASVLTLAFTYVKIVRVARGACGDASGARKARSTVAFHGVQYLLYALSVANEALMLALGSLIADVQVSSVVRLCVYMLLFIVSRFVAPFIYGVRDKEIRRHLRRMLGCGTGKVVDGVGAEY
ncbi:odorant receptor 131-2-like [Lethenteron reissneri]|uniref:odorant receptor 131-2-like n=1 Tax=Lethenteron reissneri TaxID=7753 RepID=UPI002AB6848F|nr:odorant receptor 131-2-like [Lethenteron reissneri]